MAPYEWHLDHTARTIFVRGYGEGTTADTLQLIEEMKGTISQSPDYDFLYDSTALRIESSPADMIRVARKLFEDVGAKFRRFAIVVPPGRVPLARIFAALAHPFGVTANVFGDQETAREWLAGKPEARAPRQRAADEQADPAGRPRLESAPEPPAPEASPAPEP